MHFFENVYQYKTGNKLFSKTIRDTTVEGDPGVWYSEIYSLPVSGSTYYLAKCHAIYSSRDGYQGIKTFNITGNNLYDTAKLFKTEEGINSSLDLSFEFGSVYREERPVRLIEYDANTKTITVPEMVGDSVTDKRIAYIFNGRFFEEKD
jgi:hypothetical protein